MAQNVAGILSLLVFLRYGLPHLMTHYHTSNAKFAMALWKIFGALQNAEFTQRRDITELLLKKILHANSDDVLGRLRNSDAWIEILRSAMNTGNWNTVFCLIRGGPRIEPLTMLDMVIDTGNLYFLRRFLKEMEADFTGMTNSKNWMEILQKSMDTGDVDVLREVLRTSPSHIIDHP
jgi:hypothetical protein